MLFFDWSQQQKEDPSKPRDKDDGTDQGLFYLTVGIGRIQVEGRDIVVLSPAAPIGKMLLGKRVWEQISFNGRNYTIEAVD